MKKGKILNINLVNYIMGDKITYSLSTKFPSYPIHTIQFYGKFNSFKNHV